MLALVLVNTLDLDVEDPFRVQFDTGGLADEPGEAGFVVSFDVAPLLTEGRIVNELLEAAQPIEIGQPALTDSAVQQFPQPRIGQRQKASWCYAFRFVA